MAKKQESLFAEYEEQTEIDATVLYMPQKKAFEKIKIELYNHTMQELTPWSEFFNKWLRRNNWKLDANGNSNEEARKLQYILSGTKTSKEALVNILALFLADKRNLSIYFDGLTKEHKTLWETALQLIYIDADLYKEITGKSLVKKERWSYYGNSLIRDYVPPFFAALEVKASRSSYGYRENSYCIYIPMFFRDIARAFFHERKQKPHALPELPDDGQQLTVLTDTDREMAQHLPLIQSFVTRGVLIVGSKGKVAANVRKKVTSKMTLREFVPTTEASPYQYMRTNMTLYLCATCIPKRVEKLELADIVASMYDEICENAMEMMPLYMAHVGGLKQNYMYTSDFNLLLIDMVDCLKKLGRGWISINDIIEMLYSMDMSSYTLIGTYAYNRMDLVNKKTGEDIGVSDLHDQLYKPTIKGVLLLMSSVGMLDVAFSKPSILDSSYVDSLAYVRMNDLGAFLLGVEKEYKPIVVEQKKYFELDDNMLILKSVVDDNPYKSLVEDIAQNIGGERYKLSGETFLKHCETEKDVEEQVNIFKQFVSGDCPKVWDDFFKSMKSKCKPLTPFKRDEYAVYKVQSENRELQRLLSTDEVLRQHVVRAEGYIILIRKDDKQKVVDRLKKFGYLI